MTFAILPALLVLVIVFLAVSIKVLLEFERAVVFTLGKYSYTAGPGLIFVIPVLQSFARVDMRTLVEDVPSQDVISRDNVTVKVSAVLYYRVVDPARSIIQVYNFRRATSELAQTTLRSVLGHHELDDMLSERDKLNEDLQNLIDKQTESWGIKVQNVEIKHIDLDETMVRAMAKQAEAERMRRAKIINAEGEYQSAQRLLDAGRLLGEDDNAMSLRYLSAMQEMASQPSNTILAPLPTSLFERLLGSKK